MKKILIFLALLMFAISGIAQAETLSSDQVEVKSLIQKMYAIDQDVFESATFGAKYKNGDNVISGKYDPPRQCRLLAEYLAGEAVIKGIGINQPCMTGIDGFFRYPGLDVVGEGMHDAPLPKPRINTPVIKAGQAKVYVEFKYGGNIFYYLKKLPEGWRIYRVESRPTDDWRSENKEIRDRADEATIFPPEKRSTR